mgnify:CR=1 FL=1
MSPLNVRTKRTFFRRNHAMPNNRHACSARDPSLQHQAILGQFDTLVGGALPPRERRCCHGILGGTHRKSTASIPLQVHSEEVKSGSIGQFQSDDNCTIWPDLGRRRRPRNGVSPQSRPDTPNQQQGQELRILSPRKTRQKRHDLASKTERNLRVWGTPGGDPFLTKLMLIQVNRCARRELLVTTHQTQTYRHRL